VATLLILSELKCTQPYLQTSIHTYGMKNSSGASSSTYLNLRSGNFCKEETGYINILTIRETFKTYSQPVARPLTGTLGNNLEYLVNAKLTSLLLHTLQTRGKETNNLSKRKNIRFTEQHS